MPGQSGCERRGTLSGTYIALIDLEIEMELSPSLCAGYLRGQEKIGELLVDEGFKLYQTDSLSKGMQKLRFTLKRLLAETRRLRKRKIVHGIETEIVRRARKIGGQMLRLVASRVNV